ncbi:MAG: carboxypeptidase regulatory-like domain-containing protein [Candidatus Sulfotelmatobacter sp.]
MSDLLQTGHHPDADQLNAFVEHALPAHEQEQTLAHLALCPACRQIVALSLPPAAESPAPQPEPTRKYWFFRWPLAWAGIPAVAALVLFIIFIRNGTTTARQKSAPTQMATTRPPASLVAPATPRIPATASNKQQPATTLTGSNAPSPPRHLNQKRAVAGANQPSQSQMEALQQPGRGASSGAIGGVLGGIASQSPQLQVGKAVSQPVPAPPATTVNNAASVSVGGPVANVPQPASIADALTINGRALDRAQNALSTQSPLPSHVAVLSMAASAHQRLAIDAQNHLFFSNDDGRHWKAVPAQWKGRAVAVALASPVSFSGTAPTFKVSSRPTAIAGSALSGTITDPSGAVIPGATVTATNFDATLVRSAQTDGRGQFRIDNIAPGGYRLEAQAPGFQKQASPIEVTASQQTTADVTLQTGAVSQTVEVQASPSPIATESPTVTQSIDAKKTSEPAVRPTLSHFEITTDTGDRWTSTDGQTWKHE